MFCCAISDFSITHVEGPVRTILLASGASPPSDVNGRFFDIYIYMFVTGTVHTVMLYVLLILHAHSPTMHSTSNLYS